MTQALAILELLLRVMDLGEATFTTSPNTYLTKQDSYRQSAAALEASTPELPANVLLGMAWVESRYSADAVSRIENGKRVVGIPKWKIPPKGTHSFFCGVTQASAGNSWKKCRELKDVSMSYRTAVWELNKWLSPRICNHNLICALTGYNGGFPALKIGTKYAATVLWRAWLINKALTRGNHGRDRTTIKNR